MRTIIIPIGSFEQHGPHLPPTTDALIAEALATAVSLRTGADATAPVPISCSHEHAGVGVGAVSCDPGALLAYLGSIVDDALDGRWDRIVVLNCHGGNYLLGNLAQRTNARRGPVLMLAPRADQVETAFAAAGIETSVHDDMHGGEWETSIMLASRPELVRMDLAADVAAMPRHALLMTGMAPLTTTGIVGRPTLATAEKGQAALDALAGMIADEMSGMGWCA